MDTNEVRCAVCGKAIGRVVEVAPGVVRLQIGSLYINVARGVCVCGAEFHWSISERMLAELIRYVMQLRKVN